MKHLFLPGFLLLLGLAEAIAGSKQIALSFDDAPRPDSSLSSQQRTERLLNGLTKAGVEQVVFYVTTKHLADGREQVLDAYLQAGHLVANHSDQHLWLHKTPLEDYQQDVLSAHQRLHQLPHFRPWFRFPFLDEGRTREKHQAMQAFLQQQGYQNGYVTVDNYDWYLDKLYQDAHKAGHTINMEQLGKLYVEVLWAAINHSDQVAMQYLSRSPKHVLLLHDNDLAALFITDLIAHLREQGWEIISPETAYQDPIARQIPQTLFNGQGRVAALAHVRGAQPADLVHVAEDEQQLKTLFDQYGVVTAETAARQTCSAHQTGISKPVTDQPAELSCDSDSDE